jgi:hypothetical protein
MTFRNSAIILLALINTVSACRTVEEPLADKVRIDAIIKGIQEKQDSIRAESDSITVIDGDDIIPVH